MCSPKQYISNIYRSEFYRNTKYIMRRKTNNLTQGKSLILKFRRKEKKKKVMESMENRTQ